MRKAILLLALGAIAASIAAPASALSCAAPDPVDLVGLIRRSDGAAVATISEVTDPQTEYQEVTVDVVEVFKGRFESPLTLLRPASVWGPYYQPGEQLALIADAGVITDGNQSICGPYYSGDQLRQAAEESGLSPTPPPPAPFWSRVLRLLVRFFGF